MKMDPNEPVRNKRDVQRSRENSIVRQIGQHREEIRSGEVNYSNNNANRPIVFFQTFSTIIIPHQISHISI